MSAPTVLLAEDDIAIRDLLLHHLDREGFRVVAVADGLAALRAARAVASLAILDVGLPGMDGFEVARTLRREGHDLPIMMLTARSDEVDRVVGFELGADDYVVKPFSPHEVVARVKAILRRIGRGTAEPMALLQFDRMEVDESAREVRVDGTPVRLKPREFALLLELARNPGVALSRDRLLERVWGYGFIGDPRTVDVHGHRLRLKLETAATSRRSKTTGWTN
ncbi:MAG: response regulator transcription factor [Candidatus Eremiobacteraeota bacterium]|nr:response regulator transcription factor [Candidatus Eremiobacteraeota bacterium]